MPPIEQRCTDCGRLLFKASGTDARVEIRCKCGRIVNITIGGKAAAAA